MTLPQGTPRRRDAPISPSTGALKWPSRKTHRTAPLPGWKPETARPKSPVPLITVVAGGTLLVAVIGKLLLSFVASHGVHFERLRLKVHTQAFATSLDVSQVKALTGTAADESTPAFKALVARLNEIRKDNPEVRFTYLMGWNGSAVVFLLDSTDPASSDYSPPGETYEDATPELVRSFAMGKPFVEGPVTDRWGTWVSGLAPVKDPSSGQVIAVMGMDVDATRWNVTLGVSRLLAYLIIGLLLGVVVFFARRLHAIQ
jgi:hypothetical protein